MFLYLLSTDILQWQYPHPDTDPGDRRSHARAWGSDCWGECTSRGLQHSPDTSQQGPLPSSSVSPVGWPLCRLRGESTARTIPEPCLQQAWYEWTVWHGDRLGICVSLFHCNRLKRWYLRDPVYQAPCFIHRHLQLLHPNSWYLSGN